MPKLKSLQPALEKAKEVLKTNPSQLYMEAIRFRAPVYVKLLEYCLSVTPNRPLAPAVNDLLEAYFSKRPVHSHQPTAPTPDVPLEGALLTMVEALTAITKEPKPDIVASLLTDESVNKLLTKIAEERLKDAVANLSKIARQPQPVDEPTRANKTAKA